MPPACALLPVLIRSWTARQKKQEIFGLFLIKKKHTLKPLKSNLTD